MALEELYWFLKYKPRTETRENVYIITIVSREPRQIMGHIVSCDKSSMTIQQMVGMAPEAEQFSDHCAAIATVLEKGRDGEIYNIGGSRTENPILHRLLMTVSKQKGLLSAIHR